MSRPAVDNHEHDAARAANTSAFVSQSPNATQQNAARPSMRSRTMAIDFILSHDSTQAFVAKTSSKSSTTALEPGPLPKATQETAARKSNTSGITALKVSPQPDTIPKVPARTSSTLESRAKHKQNVENSTQKRHKTENLSEQGTESAPQANRNDEPRIQLEVKSELKHNKDGGKQEPIHIDGQATAICLQHVNNLLESLKFRMSEDDINTKHIDKVGSIQQVIHYLADASI